MNQQSSVRWLFSQIGDKKPQMICSVCIALLGVICQVIPYLLVGRMITQLLNGNQDFSFYLPIFIQMGLCFIGKSVCHAISTSLSHVATFTILSNIRKQGLEHLSNMPLGDVLSRSAGEIKNTLVERIDAMETTLAHIIPELTSNIMVPVFLAILLFCLDWRMGLASLLTLPIGMFCLMAMMNGYEENFKRTVDATKKLNDTAVEYIEGIQVIKAFSKSKTSYARFVQAAKEAAHSYIDWMRACIGYQSFGMTILPATLLTVLPIGTFMVYRGTLEVDMFLTCMIISIALIGPLVTCMSYIDDLSVISTLAQEVRSICEAPVMKRPKDRKTIGHYDLSLEQVRFGYQDKEVLHGISMEILEGSYVALVGPSGSGKSTIARLIASLWDVKDGSIQLDGIDIRNIPLDQYSDCIAYVSQDNYLFNQSIRENIRMGKTKGEPATNQEVEEVAKRSGCYDFIMNLEHGFDTVVGSSGGHLSGGERQRIAIARAMLKDAPIVILDEATAYTDPENESLIQQSVAQLVQGKTLIVIAHRLSTIKDADCIYVIEDGEIVEQGKHEQLLSRYGLYESMWRAHMSIKDTREGGTSYA